jgi:ribosomal protein L37AE/L43A
MTQFQVAAVFGRAYCRAANIGNAVNGFARSGVWPVNRTVFQDHDRSASTVLQDDSETSNVETTPSNPGSPSTRAGCSSHISVDPVSPLPKAASTAKISRTSQGQQRASVLTSSHYKAQLELQEGKKKKMATASDPGCGNKKAKRTEVDSWFCDMCQQEFVEDMVRCMTCNKWFHETCAGVKKGRERFFCFACVRSLYFSSNLNSVYLEI